MRRLMNELTKLPSIGEKSAARLAYHMLAGNQSDSRLLAESILESLEKIRFCEVCFFLSETPICSICADAHRDMTRLCVVEKPADVFAIERCGGFRGYYHVLHGVWSPLRGRGPETTKIEELISRLKALAAMSPLPHEPLSQIPAELIVATGTTVEGDATALYLADHAAALGISVSRIAQGLPKGGELEFADDMTLSLSLEGRRRM